MENSLTSVVSIAIIIILAGVVSYQVGASRYDRRIRDIDLDIVIKEFSVADLEREISRLEVLRLEEGIPIEGKKVVQTPSELLNCLMCHDLEQVRGFHYPERIMQIQEAKGLRRRICINCHGPPVNSTSIPDPTKPYPADDSHPHRIHQTKLDTREITCDTCHEYEGEFRYPKPREGQLLVCELCHANGNFITIHIDGQILKDGVVDPVWVREGEKHKCQECHIGDVLVIHKAATARLGQGY